MMTTRRLHEMKRGKEALAREMKTPLEIISEPGGNIKRLAFWFELIRQDKVLEAATQTLISTIREKTGNPFFFGEPFVA